MFRTITFIGILSLAILGIFQAAPAQNKGGFDGFKLVDKAGNIHKPADYRDTYEMLGSWTVLDPKGNQIHSTYASPGASEYYRKNKTFADGTVLVKEIHGTAEGQMTTGNVNWATDPPQVWFMLIKDAKGRFASNPLWGNGWGWALFKADAPDKQVATNFKKDCLNCHVPAKADDWIYVKGYPVLHSK